MSTIEAKALFSYTAKTPTELDVTASETLYVINKDLGNGFSLVRNSNGIEGMVPTNIYKMKRSNQEFNNDNGPNIEKENDVNVNLRKKNQEDDFDSIINKVIGNNTEIESAIESTSDLKVIIEIKKEESNEILQWKPLGEFQKCQIESYGVDTKGLQRFITYNLKSSFTEKVVTRNFKDFELFRVQLRDRFPCILVPSLPSRVLIATFKNKLVLEGKKQLELWLNYILDHPVLTNNKFTKSFFEEEFHKNIQNRIDGDFKNKEFYEKVDAPIIGRDWNNYPKRMENMFHFIENLDKFLCGLQEGFNRFHKEHIEQTCMTYEKFGNSINNFYAILSLNPDNDESDSKFNNEIKDVSVVFGKIGTLFTEQAGIDSIFVESSLAEIINVTKEIPRIMETPKCIKTLLRNKESKFDSLTEKEVERIELIAKTVDAELNYLKIRRKRQIKSTMTQYVTNQINLFKQITEVLNDTLSVLKN